MFTGIMIIIAFLLIVISGMLMLVVGGLYAIADAINDHGSDSKRRLRS